MILLLISYLMPIESSFKLRPAVSLSEFVELDTSFKSFSEMYPWAFGSVTRALSVQNLDFTRSTLACQNT